MKRWAITEARMARQYPLSTGLSVSLLATVLVKVAGL